MSYNNAMHGNEIYDLDFVSLTLTPPSASRDEKSMRRAFIFAQGLIICSPKQYCLGLQILELCANINARLIDILMYCTLIL